MAVAAAAALLLSACAGGGNTADPATPDESDLPEGVVLRDDGAYMLERNDPVEGGTLRIALEAAVEGVDPARSEGSGTAQVMRAVFDELFRWDTNGQVVPQLAEGIETDDGGKTWTLRLRPGIDFTDGTPLDAQAVIDHWTRIGVDGSPSRSAAEVRQIESMTPKNPTTVEIVLKTASPSFPKAIVGNPSHMNYIGSPAAFAQWGAEIGFHPVGAGPFMMTSFTSGGNAVVERNPDYWRDGLPYLDEIEFVAATDTQSRLAAAVAGDIDLGMSQIGVDLQSAERQGLLALYQPATTYFDVIFNLAKPPFNDVRFREAVIRGINLDGMNTAVFGGLNTPMTGILPEDNTFFLDTDWPAYDPDKAKELLADWQADNPDVEPAVRFSIASPPINQGIGAVTQQMLGDIGIAVELTTADQPTLISEARTGNYHMQLRFIGITAEVDQVLFSNFYSTSAGNNSQGGDPTVDRLLIEARSASTLEERTEINHELQEAFREWLPILPLIQHRNGWYVGERVGGFPGVIPGVTTPDVAELYITE